VLRLPVRTKPNAYADARLLVRMSCVPLRAWWMHGPQCAMVRAAGVIETRRDATLESTGRELLFPVIEQRWWANKLTTSRHIPVRQA
jgi:hypothetical protein